MSLTKIDNSAMTWDEVSFVQSRLSELGFDPGPIDGIMGPHTESAIIAYKRANGLKPRPYIGTITWEMLSRGQGSLDPNDDLPWMIEAKRALNRHEVHDNRWLKKWLASDGHTLGDPAQLPWCGDFIETAIRLALPNEVVPKNPYWALNWLKFGIPCKPTYGAVAAIKRSGGGHVMFIIGEDDNRYYALGGNQSDKSSIVPVSKHRFQSNSFRWPKTHPVGPGDYLPRLNSSSAANTKES